MKRKRRINKRKLRERAARDAAIEHYRRELKRAKVPPLVVGAATEMMRVILRDSEKDSC